MSERFSELRANITKATSIGFGFGEGEPVYAKGVKWRDEVQRYLDWKRIAEKRQPSFRFAVGLRFYVASSLANVKPVRRMVRALKREGHIHTYCWDKHGAVFRGKGTHVEMGMALALKKGSTTAIETTPVPSGFIRWCSASTARWLKRTRWRRCDS